jgi:hypothetical protein
LYTDPRPPTFGSRLDFERAVFELKWLGKDDDQTVARVAQKYTFPPDFLRKGVFGLTEDDTLMGKSKWWPIIAQWNEQYEEAKYSVERAIARRGKITWELIAFGGTALSAGVSLGIITGINLAIPVVSVAVGFVIAMYFAREDWEVKVEEEIHRAEALGYPNIGDQFEEFSQRDPLLAFFTFKRLSKERAPSAVLDLMGVEYEKDEPIPVFEVRENVDQEYAKRVEQMEPRLKFVEGPVGRLDVALRYEGRVWGMQLLTVRVKNGNLPLSRPLSMCEAKLEDIKTYRAVKLPWLPVPFQELVLPADAKPEVWGELKKHVSYKPVTIGKGEDRSILLGYGLESTASFYFATDPPRGMRIKASELDMNEPGFLASLPFKLIVGADGMAPIVSKETALIGREWNDLQTRHVETKSLDEKKITFKMENQSNT